eukprot:CAMPEP_0170647330 /NCGR_PEP_ID=MMETSP0224-20130122/44126_1 /TAXON_ID=285029 /ORGANISM="Togula jolla, Strain CCCM 725" /LENGTH=51 /DNA_ID=CAMNT_0010978747 /DNA_START=101 /DNA_END=252 /DNA_ORIENTATION=+
MPRRATAAACSARLGDPDHEAEAAALEHLNPMIQREVVHCNVANLQWHEEP